MKIELLLLLIGFASLIITALSTSMSNKIRIWLVVVNLITILSMVYLIHFKVIELIGICTLS